jgi:methylenetetrahydrofolate reductase (NADPH)
METRTNRSQAKKHILVVSSKPDLAELTDQAAGGIAGVEYASNEVAAREKINQSHPEIIILGQLESAAALLRFCRELKQGWISRHSSLLVVELNTSDEAHRILSEDNIEVGIGEYSFLTGNSSPLIPKEYFLSRLREKIVAKLKSRENGFKNSILDASGFCLTWEQIPGMGAFETRQEMVLENARKAAEGDKICSISITDNPGGNPAIATEILCSEIRKIGIEPLVHLAFRDKSRNQCESLLYQLAALDINNLLILTGDYPAHTSFRGTSRPVFDLDAVNGLQLMREMNAGMEHEIMRKKTYLSPTDFFAGVAMSPFKSEEAELMGQYYKLKKKIDAGADFIITQVGYDVRKWHELYLWLKAGGKDTPVMASIYVLTPGAAAAMYGNHVPGCVVTDKLLAQIIEESKNKDRGRQARLERAAKMFAIAKGMGLRGAVISGQGIPYENVEYIIQQGEALVPKWQELVREFDYPQSGGFYFFEKDPQTGLNSSRSAVRNQKPSRPLIYGLSGGIHTALFEPRSPLFKLMQPLAGFIDSHRMLEKSFGAIEFWSKAVLYGCQNCGDCALFDVAYLCPVSQCPKNQRNGPCGGSFEGWCEVYPNEKKCIWERAYRRLKAQHREHTIAETIVPPNDWSLWQTSSWLNYFLGRDHVSKRAGVKSRSGKNDGA